MIVKTDCGTDGSFYSTTLAAMLLYAALLGYATCKLTIRHTHHHHGPSPDQLCAYQQRTAGEIFLHTLSKIGRTA